MTADERLAKDGFAGIEPILFYYPSNENGIFSNFSPHPIVLPNPFDGIDTYYATGEHRYQAMKSKTKMAHEYIRTAYTPSDAKKYGGMTDLRDGWGNNYGDLCWYVMTEVVRTKVRQHKDAWYSLWMSDDKPIYEDSPTDDIWGWRFEQSHTGKNLLGRCWMEARVEMVPTPKAFPLEV